MPASNGANPLARCRAIVLAAGRGTRMGGSKALMTVAGRPWWQVQAERLADIPIAPTWVVSESVRATLAASPQAPAGMVTGDSSTPMFASILAGLSSLDTSALEGVFILPVDVPAPAAAVWTALAATNEVAIPSYAGTHGHPVFLPHDAVRDILTAARRPNASLLRLDTLIGPIATIVPVDDPTISVNLNTMDDIDSFLRFQASPPRPTDPHG